MNLDTKKRHSSTLSIGSFDKIVQNYVEDNRKSMEIWNFILIFQFPLRALRNLKICIQNASLEDIIKLTRKEKKTYQKKLKNPTTQGRNYKQFSRKLKSAKRREFWLKWKYL